MINDTVTREELKEDKKSKKEKLPKEISQEILKKMFENLLRAIGIMLYFIILNLAYSTMKKERLIGDIKVFAGAFLVAGIIFLEKAYKKDNGSIAVNGIECMVLSLHSLSIMHVITLFKYNFMLYLLTSSYIFSIYYVLKAIVLYTKGRREYLNSLSDISEIVKKDNPVVKEAKKKNEKEETKNRIEDTEKSKSGGKTKNSEKTKIEIKPIKKKATSKIKLEETATTKKKTTKSKVKKLEEDKVEEKTIVKKKTTKPKNKMQKEKMKENQTEKNKTSKTKKKPIKEEKTEKGKKEKETKVKTEELKTPEKKKRGRPKKEVMKND